MEAQHAVKRDERPGWVTRTYPAVFDTWQLSPIARDAARLLYSSCEPGDLVEIVHAQFYMRLPCRDETSSRDAFRGLEKAGVLRCVFRRRGRNGRTIYRLGDPIEAYRRRGLGLLEADPQLLLPFAEAELQASTVEDLGGGVLRLWQPEEGTEGTKGTEGTEGTEEESGNSPGLNAQESGNSPGLNAQESGNSPGLTEEESGKFPGLNGSLLSGKGGRSVEAIAGQGVAPPLRPGNALPSRDASVAAVSPTFCVAPLQESQERSLSQVKVTSQSQSQEARVPGPGNARASVGEVTPVDALRESLGEDLFALWIAPCRVELEAGTAVIYAPDAFHAERLGRRLSDVPVAGGAYVVRVDPGLGDPHPEPTQPVTARDSGRVWSMRIKSEIDACRVPGEPPFSQQIAEEAAGLIVQQRIPAHRVERLLKRMAKHGVIRRTAGGYFNTGMSELCQRRGEPWREPKAGRRPR